MKVIKMLIVLSLIGVCINFQYVSGKEIDYIQTKTIIYNEYESIIDSKNREDLNNYIDGIQLLSTKSNVELSKEGYNNIQIYAIKHFDGSQKMLALASASMTASVYISSYSYNQTTNRTYATVYCYGSWSSTPILSYTDQMGIGLVGSNASFSRTSSSATITYPDYTLTSVSSEYNPMRGEVFKFGTRSNAGVFRSFSMMYSGVADGHVTVLEYGACYAHSSKSINNFSLSIGVDRNGNFSAGLSFSIGDHFTFLYNTIRQYVR